MAQLVLPQNPQAAPNVPVPLAATRTRIRRPLFAALFVPLVPACAKTTSIVLLVAHALPRSPTVVFAPRALTSCVKVVNAARAVEDNFPRQNFGYSGRRNFKKRVVTLIGNAFSVSVPQGWRSPPSRNMTVSEIIIRNVLSTKKLTIFKELRVEDFCARNFDHRSEFRAQKRIIRGSLEHA